LPQNQIDEMKIKEQFNELESQKEKIKKEFENTKAFKDQVAEANKSLTLKEIDFNNKWS
jgi:hypothetical protein